jgi:hypothetical protein
MFVACATLSPGALAESVRKLFSGCGSSTQLHEDGNIWRVSEKAADGWKSVASLEFKNGRLLRTTRTWANVRDEEAHAVVSKLLSLVSSLTGESKAKSAVVSVSTLRDPRGDLHILELRVDKRHITIYVSRREEDGPRVQIDETAE